MRKKLARCRKCGKFTVRDAKHRYGTQYYCDLCLEEMQKRKANRKVYARMIEDFLKDTKIKYFKAAELSKKMGIAKGEIIAGLKELKKQGKIEKITTYYWMVKTLH